MEENCALTTSARFRRVTSLAWLLGIATVAGLPTVMMAKSIVGIGIAKSNDRVYTWFNDGTVTQGNSGNLQKYDMRRARPYQVPGVNATPLDIVAMSIAKNDHVYTWYTDGTRSIGTSTNLGAYQGRQAVNLHGKSMSDIVGIGIAGSNDHVYVWYKDQTKSIGTSGDFQAYQAPAHYDLPNDPLNPGTALTPADIVEIDIAKNDRVYTWYRNGTRSTGTSGQLGKYDVNAYLKSHVLYSFSRRSRNPNGPPQGPSVPANGGIPPITTYCDSHDAMVAVSPNFIGVTDTAWMKFTDRNGNAIDLRLSGGDPCGGFSTVQEFFSSFFDPTSELFIDHNVGFTRACDDPSLPLTNNIDASGVNHKFCVTDLYDVRIIYDPVSKHFFLIAQVRNAISPYMSGEPDHPWACGYFKNPKGDKVFTKDRSLCLMARHQKLFAVSKSENPQDGFHQYLVTETQDADWPWIGVNGSRVVLSDSGDMDEPPVWPVEEGVVQVFDLDSVATGKQHPPFFEYFPEDLDGLKSAMPAAYHGNDQGMTYLVSTPGRLAIFGIADDPDPWHATPLLVTHEFGTSQKGPSAEGVAYRNGVLYFVDSTDSAKLGPFPKDSPQTYQNSVRVVSVHVEPNGQSLDSWVDLDETFDPDDTSISFDDPSLDVSKDGTILIGYHTEWRNWNDALTTARARIWPGGVVSDIDLLVTNGTASSGTLNCTQPCRHKNDYTTTVVDPADDTSFFTALPYTNTGKVNTAITKMTPP